MKYGEAITKLEKVLNENGMRLVSVEGVYGIDNFNGASAHTASGLSSLLDNQKNYDRIVANIRIATVFVPKCNICGNNVRESKLKDGLCPKCLERR